MTTQAAPAGEILVYEAPDGGVRVEVKLDRDTVWLTQRQMSELFETTPENVLMHLKNIYADGELEEPATAKDFLAVRMEGKRQVQRQLKHCNLDAIISVGYRVNSRRGVRFRRRAQCAQSAPGRAGGHRGRPRRLAKRSGYRNAHRV